MRPKTFMLKHSFIFIIFWMGTSSWSEEARNELRLQMSWGHSSRQSIPFSIKLLGDGLTITDLHGEGLESGEDSKSGFWETTGGGGDVDGIAFTVIYSPTPIKINEKLHPFWTEFIKQSDANDARRLLQDPAYRIDSRKIAIQMDHEGKKGFSVTLDQLLQNKGFLIPLFDIFLSAGDPAVSFVECQREWETRKGLRILDRIRTEPEASFEQFAALWEDMGRPDYVHPSQPEPGHIVCLAWDSSMRKFGVDRGAGVWSDYGNSDRFRFWYDFGDLKSGIERFWKGQPLEEGLPLITTSLTKDEVEYTVEQFAYPLDGPPKERRGDIPMTLLQKVSAANKGQDVKTVILKILHQRKLPSLETKPLIPQHQGNAIYFQNETDGQTLFSVEGDGFTVTSCNVKKAESTDEKSLPLFETELSFSLNSNQTQELIVKLPSPAVSPQDREKLLALNYEEARTQTIQFWSDYIGRGAQFRVPEKTVNDLFRASLWHALRLPRCHGSSEENAKIDIPYSNFAYGQNGIPWPVNQAVYVDYMIYDLRGYHDLSLEELLTMFRRNQEPNGHIGGYANWGVYTPSMIYAAAQHYLLSQDGKAFERLLPYTLKAMDWCLNEIRQSTEHRESTMGLIRSPLNDLTGDGIWAFTQAYVYAGLAALGKALDETGHPRAQECLKAAQDFRRSIERAFESAAMQSPLVQLRDQTWIPYVPCEALTPRRLFEQWYPTDVDTGAVHLIRLKALPADGVLADALLNDHEDNFYLKGWGMANEPVYNPQATAYLLRDDPKAVIRAFYSYMACAFSHSALEPVEHRWFWGQYFGPPSTDGAWFELYRNMLVRERDDDSLLLLQATPRKWLEDGKRIEVENAPTYYGKIAFTATSQVHAGRLTAEIDAPCGDSLKTLLLRLRHPSAKPMRSVTVNGQDWRDFDIDKEWIAIKNPRGQHYSIIASY
ncbi:MAG: hypothetical protein AB1656_19445 [Candidatus Omnitrophota bacterium]